MPLQLNFYILLQPVLDSLLVLWQRTSPRYNFQSNTRIALSLLTSSLRSSFPASSRTAGHQEPSKMH